MKIMLMDPPWYAFMEGSVRQPTAPLGSCYVAAALEKEGYETCVVNVDLLTAGKAGQYSFTSEMGVFREYLRNSSNVDHPIWREVERIIREYVPDVLGLSARTSCFPSALLAAAIAKNIDPGIRVVIGGPHPTLMPDEAVRGAHVDAIVRGEGEVTMVELIRAWEDSAPLDQVAGISYWDKATQSMVHTPPRSLIVNLDDIPFPAKHLIMGHEELMDEDDFNTLLNSRGCPHKCIFCSSPSVWRRKARYRSAKNMVREIRHTYEQFNTRFFSFQDDTFTLNSKVVMALCDEMIANELPEIPGFRWVCNTRPELLTRPLVARMKEAGCSAIAIGIESGNDEVLRQMKKGFTKNQVREAVRIIKDSGLVFSAQFLIGFPFETEEQMWDTARFAEELEPVSIVLSVAAPLPGTELYTMAQQMGYSPEQMDFTSLTTKNDGILFNKEYSSEQARRILSEIKGVFDGLQERTLETKNESRLKYERLYKKGNQPVYGFKAVEPKPGVEYREGRAYHESTR